MAKIYQVQDGGVRNDTPIMIRVIRICRNCGAKIFSDAPEGLCTGCVLEAAIGGAGDSSAVAAYSAEAAAKAGLFFCYHARHSHWLFQVADLGQLGPFKKPNGDAFSPEG